MLKIHPLKIIALLNPLTHYSNKQQNQTWRHNFVTRPLWSRRCPKSSRCRAAATAALSAPSRSPSTSERWPCPCASVRGKRCWSATEWPGTGCGSCWGGPAGGKGTFLSFFGVCATKRGSPPGGTGERIWPLRPPRLCPWSSDLRRSPGRPGLSRSWVFSACCTLWSGWTGTGRCWLASRRFRSILRYLRLIKNISSFFYHKLFIR